MLIADQVATALCTDPVQVRFRTFKEISSDDSINSFNGGVGLKSAIVLALSSGTKTYLFLYRDGKISRLGEFNSSGYGWIEVKHVSSSKVIFLLRTHGAVDPAGRRIAYCYWAGDKRHIVVKELAVDIAELR